MDELVGLLRLAGAAGLPLTLASWAVWALARVQHLPAEPFRTIATWLCVAAMAVGVLAACWVVVSAAISPSAEKRKP